MKKGFTLIELLAVIALVALLGILALPKVIEIFNESTTKTMKVSETEILDAANLFVEDYCKNPIDNSYRTICNDSLVEIERGVVYFCLKTLQDNKVIKKTYFGGNVPCDGIVVYNYEANINKFYNGKTYLICSENLSPYNYDFEYNTDGFNDYSEYLFGCLED